ncbi:LOW QUALITY PROTEIN: hypothetical protein BRADI_1g55492v3 [Brachypodium distachyon]|uniref:F-box domain-containing protein n=1 Tax=Brachypodium distachyon TaxID=15368 RepID=A0A2K2DRK2_BRADI|nr:LOW QUALITY PROTEIN: hypothetical protein BRADI_1g55492v3 [Brachypodium distachyon]
MGPCPSRHSPPPLSPELLDDLVLEILLRIPPDRPEALVRASCQSLARAALSPTPPSAAATASSTAVPRHCWDTSLRSELTPSGVPATTFLPATAFHDARHGHVRPYHVLRDARHGHVLIEDIKRNFWRLGGLVVWYPITEISHRVPWPPNTPCLQKDAEFAVLCGCHGGHFLVVSGYRHWQHSSTASARIYSSRDGVGGAWSDRTSVELPAVQSDGALMKGRSVLVDQEYNTVDQDLKVITLPPSGSGSGYKGRIYMSAEDGTLAGVGRPQGIFFQTMPVVEEGCCRYPWSFGVGTTDSH